MKLFAQHGAQAGDKISAGLEHGVIEGVIYGAKDITPERLRTDLDWLAAEYPRTTRLLDTHYAAALVASEPGARLGYLIGEKGHGYFQPRLRRDLERLPNVEADLRACLGYQASLPLTALIAPNIVVRRSLDSAESVIAKSFIRQTAAIAREVAPDRAVFATLAISQNALGDRAELSAFLQEITELEDPPVGFYLLLDKAEAMAPSCLVEAGVLARWLLVAHTLKVSGFRVIHGYCDMIAPYLAATGADAGACGWFSTLKTFSLGKFAPSKGFAARPIPRYASIGLLKSIRHTELHALRNEVPGVLNGMPSDALYPEDEGSTPSVAYAEAVQNWAAIGAMIAECRRPSIGASLDACVKALDRADNLYAQIAMALPLRLDERSNADHVPAIRAELQEFAKLAEL
jgi:hypothetical protein